MLCCMPSLLLFQPSSLLWYNDSVGPTGISLLLNADYVNGVALLIYGFFIIGGVDNVARFLLQKKLADIHPLITVFGVLIGIPLFGFWGCNIRTAFTISLHPLFQHVPS